MYDRPDPKLYLSGDSFEDIGDFRSYSKKMTLKTEGWEFPGNRSLGNPPKTCGDDGYICIDPERESFDTML